MNEVTRYDGTRFITEEEIDVEFEGCYVVIEIKNDSDRDGYLIASVHGDAENSYSISSDIAMDEIDTNATIVYGTKLRGLSIDEQIHHWLEQQKAI
ncbi:MAG: hypothetical protein FWB74_09600 [Defluviitaleaceae bacterium]|nr:hypothetical protein [Defluviitaleaceae bacterium]